MQKRPVARAFTVGEKTVHALAVPSPGSPQRKIRHFGFTGEGSSIDYAESYFKNAFNWLTAKLEEKASSIQMESDDA